MTKIIERNVAEILVIAIFAIMFLSSCQTVKEVRGKTNNLSCTHVSR